MNAIRDIANWKRQDDLAMLGFFALASPVILPLYLIGWSVRWAARRLTRWES